MKKILLPFLLLGLVACHQHEVKDYALLTGSVSNMEVGQAKLFGPDFSKEINISNNAFSDTIHINHNGFFDLIIEGVGVKIYLEKGKTLDVDLDVQRDDNPFVYGNDLKEPNEVLYKINSWSRENLNPRSLYKMEENDFLETLKTHQLGLQNLISEHAIQNKEFEEMLTNENKYFEIIMKENYQGAHRYFNKTPHFLTSKSFYESIGNFKYTDTLTYRRSSTYQEVVSTHYDRISEAEATETKGDQTLIYMQKVDADFPNGFAKNKLMYEFLRYGLTPNESLEAVFTIYKNSNPDMDELQEVTGRYEALQKILPGNPSPTFDYENYKGGTVALSDLKGKYVYIDVWATWCGPCLEEIPFLKKMEADYADKNIQIISISIDTEDAYGKWRDMVEERSLGGLQLMADNDWRSKFVSDYSIFAIPRFILIDTEGNIISADAPRPSSLAIHELLSELL